MEQLLIYPRILRHSHTLEPDRRLVYARSMKMSIAGALVAIAMTGSAGSPQAPTDRPLHDEIVRADRVMFDAFKQQQGTRWRVTRVLSYGH
jgi:hypothetical protein